ncbi:MAG: hypothetical protein H6Q36_1877 [Chloroflexi bacterium]|nr:hypothetical protein [Chloroflexota bacterium]
MSDGLSIAAALLVVGPVFGAIGVANPALLRAWTAPRDEHLATVGAHRRAWMLANAGFTLATIATAAGLVVLAGAVDLADGPRAILAAVAAVYLIAGAQWCTVLAIRNGTTPALADMVAVGTATEPAETLLGRATAGIFATFTLATGAALAILGFTLALGGVIAAPVALLAMLIAVLAIFGFLARGDMPPFVLYIPTLLVGLALLLGGH